MDDEIILSGYCRSLDCSRMVTAELENGVLTCADCDYGSCPWQQECTVARRLAEYEQ